MSGYRVTYNGDGIISNELGVFQRHTAANTTDEAIANRLASDPAWEVIDSNSGRRLYTLLTPSGFVDSFTQPSLSDFAPSA